MTVVDFVGLSSSNRCGIGRVTDRVDSPGLNLGSLDNDGLVLLILIVFDLEPVYLAEVRNILRPVHINWFPDIEVTLS